MAIKIILYKSKTKKINITNMVKQITWSGDINTFPRKIDVQIMNTKNSKKDNLISYDMGNLVVFYENNNEIFRGFIFRRSMSHNGEESFVAYDELIYVSKNSDTLMVKKRTASAVIISLFKKFGIAIGDIEPTGHKISKLVFTGSSLTEIIEKLLRETRKHNSKRYRLYSKKGKVYMVSRSKAPVSKISIKDVISANKEISIEDTKTQVMVTKGSIEGGKDSVKYKSYTIKDNDLVKKYGVMQEVETVDDKASYETMKKKAKSILEQLNQAEVSVDIEFKGLTSCITGTALQVEDEKTNLVGKYYITSDSHTWSDGNHKMSLQLSKRLS